MELLYTGKAKKVYKENNDVIIEYTNNATAFNGEKHEELEDKGVLNNSISSYIYKYLEEKGIKTHFIEKIDETRQRCKKVDIIPLEVISRNRSAGSMCRRYGLQEGLIFKEKIVEFSLKDDTLGDPLICESHILAMEIIKINELELIKNTTLKINELLEKLFLSIGLILVDFKLEFGKDENGNIILADEISPDTMRLWEKDTLEKFDKDRFRNDLGDTTKYYREVLNRLEGRKCD